jgi:hypothetical protein
MMKAPIHEQIVIFDELDLKKCNKIKFHANRVVNGNTILKIS